MLEKIKKNDTINLHQGRLIIISAPSGAGKSTVIRKLLKRNNSINFSVSYTTRAPRKGEKEGVDYHFINMEQFEKMVKDRQFLEWAEVYGNRYGTGKNETAQLLENGSDILLDIDVQGAEQVSAGPIKPVKIFMLPPSKKALVRRLKKRGDLDDGQMEVRIAAGRIEMERALEFDYILVNENVKRTVKAIEAIILSEKSKLDYNISLLRKVIETFDNE